MTLEKILTDLARAIESAAAAPLLERIAGLERQLEQAKKERDAFEVLASEFIQIGRRVDEISSRHGLVAQQAGAASELNDWFLSLPDGRQKVLTDDKWMLAGAAFIAGKSEQVRKPLSDAEIADLWDGTLFHITDLSLAISFVRAVERAHNIREN